jgi:hypothetical protein
VIEILKWLIGTRIVRVVAFFILVIVVVILVAAGFFSLPLLNATY